MQPKLYGVENLPTGGSLLVGNRTVYGFLDLPFMMAEIWKRRRLAIRGLGEHAHYAVPVWRDLLTVGGMVRGTRENVRALMSTRQTILVFPGGSRGQQAARPALPVAPVLGQLACLYEKVVGFPPPPIVRGVGLTPLPRPQRLYFWFDEPIDSTRFGSRFDDTAGARALRDDAKNAILAGIQFLRDQRDLDPNRDGMARLRRRTD